ncbi:MAG: prolipoprotein diacylglyceryl transferase [Phycisphaeraceae bacterium]|nr:prolipoprotein diacylglyceryl transferase [Phycisphaeraceae bacterium]
MPLTLAAYLHDFDPFAFHLFPDGPAILQGVRWYGLSYLMGFILGLLLIRRVTRRGVSTLKPLEVWDFTLALAVGAVIGGRLGYVLFYKPSLLWDPPLLGVLQIWKGGMASHGGLIGVILACVYYARRHHHSLWHLLDLAALAFPPGLFCGRIANFINGELYGRIAPPTLPWAVQFPQEIAAWSDQRKVALIEQLPAPLIDAAYRDPVSLLLAQVRRGNSQVIRLLHENLPPRHPSQIYEALLEGLLILLVLLWVWRRPRQPGLLVGVGMISYALVRIFVEFFRQPDDHIAHLEAAHWGITRGQWLSALMFLAGLALTLYARRRAAPPQGGWRQP